MNFETANIDSEFSKLLQQFECENLDNGKIFYREDKSIYNKKKKSIDIFYLVGTNNNNSFDLETEEENIKKYMRQVCSFFASKNQETDFVNCIFFFQHESLSESQKDFYYAFTGLWEADLENERFVKNQCFTYCGIDKSSKKIYFYKTLRSDGGTEVDLSYLILRELVVQEK